MLIHQAIVLEKISMGEIWWTGRLGDSTNIPNHQRLMTEALVITLCYNEWWAPWTMTAEWLRTAECCMENDKPLLFSNPLAHEFSEFAIALWEWYLLGIKSWVFFSPFGKRLKIQCGVMRNAILACFKKKWLQDTRFQQFSKWKHDLWF